MDKLLDVRTGLSNGLESPDTESNTMLDVSINKKPQANVSLGTGITAPQAPKQMTTPIQSAPTGSLFGGVRQSGLENATPFNSEVKSFADQLDLPLISKNPFMRSPEENLQRQIISRDNNVARINNTYGEGSPKANWLITQLDNSINKNIRDEEVRKYREEASTIPVNALFDSVHKTPVTSAQAYNAALMRDEKIQKRYESMTPSADYEEAGYIKPITEVLGSGFRGIFSGNKQAIDEFGWALGGGGSIVDTVAVSPMNWVANRVDDAEDFALYGNNYSPRKAIGLLNQYKHTLKQRADAQWAQDKNDYIKQYTDVLRIQSGGQVNLEDSVNIENAAYANYLAQTEYAQFTSDWDSRIKSGAIELTPEGLGADTRANAEAYTQLMKRWKVPTELTYFGSLVTGKTANNSGIIGELAKTLDGMNHALDGLKPDHGPFTENTESKIPGINFVFGRHQSGQVLDNMDTVANAVLPDALVSGVKNWTTPAEHKGKVTTSEFMEDQSHISKYIAQERIANGTTESAWRDVYQGAMAWAYATSRNPLQSVSSTGRDVASVAIPAVVGRFNPAAGQAAMANQITASADETMARTVGVRREQGLPLTDNDMQTLAHILNVGAVADYMGDSIGLKMFNQTIKSYTSSLADRLIKNGVARSTVKDTVDTVTQVAASALANRAAVYAETRSIDKNMNFKPEEVHKLINAAAPAYGFGAMKTIGSAGRTIEEQALRDDKSALQHYIDTGEIPEKTKAQIASDYAAKAKQLPAKATKGAVNAVGSVASIASSKLRDKFGSEHNLVSVTKALNKAENVTYITNHLNAEELSDYNPVLHAVNSRQTMRDTLRDIRTEKDAATRDAMVEAFDVQSNAMADDLSNISLSWRELENNKNNYSPKEYASMERDIMSFVNEQINDMAQMNEAVSELLDNGELSQESAYKLAEASLDYINPNDMTQEQFDRLAKALGADPTSSNQRALDNLNRAWEMRNEQSNIVKRAIQGSNLTTKTMEQVSTEVLNGNTDKNGHLGINTYSQLLNQALNKGDMEQAAWVRDRLYRWIASRIPKERITPRLAETISLENTLIADLHDRAAVYVAHADKSMDSIKFLYERTPAIAKAESQPWARNKKQTIAELSKRKTLGAFDESRTATSVVQRSKQESKPAEAKEQKKEKAPELTGRDALVSNVAKVNQQLAQGKTKGIRTAINNVLASVSDIVSQYPNDSRSAIVAASAIKSIAAASSAIKNKAFDRATLHLNRAVNTVTKLTNPELAKGQTSLDLGNLPTKPVETSAEITTEEVTVDPNQTTIDFDSKVEAVTEELPDTMARDTEADLSALNMKAIKTDPESATRTIDNIVLGLDTFLNETSNHTFTDKKADNRFKLIREGKESLLGLKDKLDTVSSASLNKIKGNIRKGMRDLSAMMEVPSDVAVVTAVPTEPVKTVPTVKQVETSVQQSAIETFVAVRNSVDTVNNYSPTTIANTPAANIESIFRNDLIAPIEQLLDEATTNGDKARKMQLENIIYNLESAKSRMVDMTALAKDFNPKKTSDGVAERKTPEEYAAYSANEKNARNMAKQDKAKEKYEDAYSDVSGYLDSALYALASLEAETVNAVTPTLVRTKPAYLVSLGHIRDIGITNSQKLKSPEGLAKAFESLSHLESTVEKLKASEHTTETALGLLNDMAELYNEIHARENNKDTMAEDELAAVDIVMAELLRDVTVTRKRFSQVFEQMLDERTPEGFKATNTNTHYAINNFSHSDDTAMLVRETNSFTVTEADADTAYANIMSSNKPFNDVAYDVHMVKQYFDNMTDAIAYKDNATDLELATLAKAEKQYFDVLTKGYREGNSIKSNLPDDVINSLPRHLRDASMANFVGNKSKPLVRSKGIITMRIDRTGHYTNGAVLRSPDLFADLVYLNRKQDGRYDMSERHHKDEAYAKAYLLHAQITTFAGTDNVMSPMRRMQEGAPIPSKKLVTMDGAVSRKEYEMRNRKGTAPSFLNDPINLFMVSDSNVTNGYNSLPYELKFMIGLANTAWLQQNIGGYKVHRSFSEELVDVTDARHLATGGNLSGVKKLNGTSRVVIDQEIGRSVLGMLNLNVDSSVMPADFADRLSARVGVIGRDVMVQQGYLTQTVTTDAGYRHAAAMQKKLNESGDTRKITELPIKEFDAIAKQYAIEKIKSIKTTGLTAEEVTQMQQDIVTDIKSVHPLYRETISDDLRSVPTLQLAGEYTHDSDMFGKELGITFTYTPEIQHVKTVFNNGYFSLANDIAKSNMDVTFVSTEATTRDQIEVPSHLPVEMIKDSLEHHAKAKYVFRGDYKDLLVDAIRTENYDKLTALFGIESDAEIEATNHPLMVGTAQDKRNALLSEIGYITDSIQANPAILNDGYYMTPVAWDIGRVGYKERLNPQMYKLVREIVGLENQQRQVTKDTLNNTEDAAAMAYGVSYAMGVDDKASVTKAIDAIDRASKLSTDLPQDQRNIIESALSNGLANVSAEVITEIANIADALGIHGNNRTGQLNNLLQAYQYSQLVNGKIDSYNYNMYVDIDGKTNGFFFLLSQMPKVGEAESTIEWMHRVGNTFGDNSGLFHEYINQEGSTDAYQTLGVNVVNTLSENNSETLSVLKGLGLELVNSVGEPTKFLRELFKQPFMVYGYSAGHRAIANYVKATLAEEILKNFFKQGTNKDPAQRAKYSEQLTIVNATLRAAEDKRVKEWNEKNPKAKYPRKPKYLPPLTIDNIAENSAAVRMFVNQEIYGEVTSLGAIVGRSVADHMTQAFSGLNEVKLAVNEMLGFQWDTFTLTRAKVMSKYAEKDLKEKGYVTKATADLVDKLTASLIPNIPYPVRDNAGNIQGNVPVSTKANIANQDMFKMDETMSDERAMQVEQKRNAYVDNRTDLAFVDPAVLKERNISTPTFEEIGRNKEVTDTPHWSTRSTEATQHLLGTGKNAYSTKNNKSYAHTYTYSAPGVKGMPFTTLGTDSFVMTNALGRLQDTQVMNMFDGTGVSPWDAVKTSRAFNEAAAMAITNADTISGIMETTANIINDAHDLLANEGIATTENGHSIFNIDSSINHVGLPAYKYNELGELDSYSMYDFVSNTLNAYYAEAGAKNSFNLLRENKANNLNIEQYIMPTDVNTANQQKSVVPLTKPLLTVPLEKTGYFQAIKRIMSTADKAMLTEDEHTAKVRSLNESERRAEALEVSLENNRKARLGYDGNSLGDELNASRQGTVTPLNAISVMDIGQALLRTDVGLSPEHMQYLTTFMADVVAPLADTLTDHSINLIEDLNYQASQQADGNFMMGANEVIFMKGMDYTNPTQNHASNTEVFLHEVGHAVTLPGLISNPAFRQTIANLFNRAKKHLTVEMLMNDPTANDPADRAKAESIYNYVFNNVTPIYDTSGAPVQYVAMAEFVAYAATNERMRKALSMIDASELAGRLSDSPNNTSLWHKVMSRLLDYINDFINWFTDAPKGVDVQSSFDSALTGLLAANEKAKTNIIERTWDASTDKLALADAQVSEKVMNTLDRGANAIDGIKHGETGDVIANHAYASSMLIKSMELRKIDKKEQKAILDSIARSRNPLQATTDAFRKLLWLDSESFAAYIVDTVRGNEADSTDSMQKALRSIPKISQGRETYVDDVRKILRPFRETMSSEQSMAVTESLQADAAVLYTNYSADKVTDFLTSESARGMEIAKLRDSIGVLVGTGRNNTKVANSIRSQAYSLAQEMMFGVAHEVNNASDILMGTAHTYGTRRWFNEIPEDNRGELLKQIDSLATLHALDFMSADSQAALRDTVFDNPLGEEKSLFDTVFSFMERTKMDSAEQLFDGNLHHQRKGYLTTKLNNNVEYVYALPHEVTKYIDRGYELSDYTVNSDGGIQTLMYRKTPVTPRHKEGAMPVYNEQKRGDSILEKYRGVMPTDHFEALSKRMIERSQRDTDKKYFSDNINETNHENMVKPIRDNTGRIVDFTMLVPEDFKRDILNREMDFIENVARTGGSVIGKVDAKQISQKTYDALLDDYNQSDFKEQDFIWVHGKRFNKDGSLNPFFSQYRMMPEAIQAQAQQTFRGRGMPIRKGMVYNVMGATEIYLTQTDFIKRLEAKHPKFLKGLQMGEVVWKELVRIAKARIAVLDVKVLQMNYISNFMVNIMLGTNPIQIGRDYIEGARELERYHNVQREARFIRAKLATAKTLEAQKSLTARLQGLEMSMINSPIREMLDQGMFQSITDEVQLQDDTVLGGIKDSVGSRMERALGKKRARQVSAIPRNMFMTADSTAYKVMSRLTQYNDFVARYSLIKQLRHRNSLVAPENRKSNEQIMQEAMGYFINYAKPDHPFLQYANDIGLVWFTKYYLGIQKMIWHSWKNYPTSAASTLIAQGMLGNLEDIFQDSMASRSPTSVFNNPIEKTFKELLTVPMMDQLSYVFGLDKK